MKSQYKFTFTLVLLMVVSLAFGQIDTPSELHVYPNPSYDGKVEVVSNVPILSLLIVNNLGQSIMEVDLTESHPDKYIIYGLPVDAYTIILNTESGILYKRLIVLK